MDLDCIYEENGFQEHNPMLVSRSISEIFISNVNLFYFFKFNLGMQRASSDNSGDKKRKKRKKNPSLQAFGCILSKTQVLPPCLERKMRKKLKKRN